MPQNATINKFIKRFSQFVFFTFSCSINVFTTFAQNQKKNHSEYISEFGLEIPNYLQKQSKKENTKNNFEIIFGICFGQFSKIHSRQISKVRIYPANSEIKSFIKKSHFS